MNAADFIFLSLCVWREASNQSAEAQAGVCHSVFERIKHPGWWGQSVMTVIFHRWQYSSLTAPLDPNLTRWPSPSDPAWRQCLTVVESCWAGDTPHPAPTADSYHDISIPAPRWATEERFVRQIGRIKFYHVGVNG